MLPYHELRVEPIDKSVRQLEQYGPTSAYSSLFRGDVRIDRVLGLIPDVYRRVNPDHLTVLSVGCSFGPEIDTILAVASTCLRNLGQISITGLDINPMAIELAKKGQYVSHCALDTEFFDRHESLVQLGINVSSELGDENPDLAYLRLDTNYLRSKHAVDFKNLNIFKADDELPEADVIFCNNVLFHYTAEGAEKIARLLVNHVALGGIISFGDADDIARMKPSSMEPQGAYFNEWSRDLATKMCEIGFAPVLFTPVHDVPYAYRRLS